MALVIALEIKSEVEALAGTAIIYGDEFNRHWLRVNLFGEKVRIDSLNEWRS
jgi:hypothetical protein